MPPADKKRKADAAVGRLPIVYLAHVFLAMSSATLSTLVWWLTWRVLHTWPDIAASGKAAKKQKLCGVLEAARAVDLHVTEAGNVPVYDCCDTVGAVASMLATSSTT